MPPLLLHTSSRGGEGLKPFQPYPTLDSEKETWQLAGVHYYSCHCTSHMHTRLISRNKDRTLISKTAHTACTPLPIIRHPITSKHLPQEMKTSLEQDVPQAPPLSLAAWQQHAAKACTPACTPSRTYRRAGTAPHPHPSFSTGTWTYLGLQGFSISHVKTHTPHCMKRNSSNLPSTLLGEEHGSAGVALASSNTARLCLAHTSIIHFSSSV